MLPVSRATLRLFVIAGLAWIVPNSPTRAQYADENAITAAEDSFGKSIDFQNVGLYSQGSVRGFNPQQAGNLRIEGLYFDQQTFDLGSCLVKDTTIRVGFAALSYAFPAPTGIVDMSLRRPDDHAETSGLATFGPFGEKTIQIEAAGPIRPDFGAHVCVADGEHYVLQTFKRDSTLHFASDVEWHPQSDTDLLLFVSHSDGHARGVIPSVYTAGNVPVGTFAINDLSVPSWTTQGWTELNFGGIAKYTISNNLNLIAGIFHSRENDPMLDNIYYSLTRPLYGDLFVDLTPPLESASTSGEIRLSESGAFGSLSHEIKLSIRGRAIQREFGGDAIIPEDAQSISAPIGVPEPSVSPNAPNVDQVAQHDIGLSIAVEQSKYGIASLSILSSNYSRELDLQPATREVTKQTPFLMSARISTPPRSSAVVYVNYTQGLEDSALPPLSAINRGEPPAASRTSQVDSGLKLTAIPKTTVLLGGFQIEKPFFDVDQTDVYRNLGQISSRGEEISVSYADRGIALLIGAVHAVPTVRSTLTADCIYQCTPLGTVPTHAVVSLDDTIGSFGASLQYSYESARPSELETASLLPHQSQLALGARYERKMTGATVTFRLDAMNVGNTRSVDLSNVGLVTPILPRRFMLSVAADFKAD